MPTDAELQGYIILVVLGGIVLGVALAMLQLRGIRRRSR